MVRKSSQTNIETIAPENEQEGFRGLTADLPRHGKKQGVKKGGGFRGKVVPLMVIFLSGLVGFMIPAIQHATADKAAPTSITYGQEETDVNNDDTATLDTSEPEEEAIYEDVEYATVATNEVGYLNVRAEASTASAKLGQLDVGDKQKVLGKDGEWLKLELDPPLDGKTEGWVAAQYATLSTEKQEVE